MSEEASGYEAPAMGVLGGTVAATAVGAILGIALPLGIDGAGGLVIGLLTGLVVGAIHAWHGGVVGLLPDRADGVRVWGVLAGLTLGGSLGPVFGAAFGLIYSNLAMGGLLGLVIGPIAGILAWEASLTYADMSREE